MNSNQTYPRILLADDGTSVLYVKDENTAYWINYSPMARPMEGESAWPVTNISKVSGKKDVSVDLHNAIDPSEYNRKLSPEDKDDFTLEPMYESKDESDFIHYQNMIEKYGENYSRGKSDDFERVFGKKK